MTKTRYPAELKADALREVLELGNPVKDVAERMGIREKTLYLWVGLVRHQQVGGADEVAKLKAEGLRIRKRIKLIKEELYALRLATETLSKMYK
jgi:transposase-like protein